MSEQGYDTREGRSYDREVEVAEQRPEAREAVDHLTSAQERISLLLSQIEERAHDLLGPERPDGDVRLVGRSMTTPFADRLEQLARGYDSQADKLQDILDRLRVGL